MKSFWKLLFVLLPLQIMAQEKFIFEGSIEYERKINVHRQTEGQGNDDSWFKDIILKMPPFHNSLFSLQFKDDQTIYKPAGEVTTLDFPWLIGPAKENIILTNMNTGIRRSYKAVFEQKFIITDSLKQNEWKITDETRTIAGIECRKAVSVICDSVYVVAFYADEIPVSGGPESFGGLPGMILGLAIPRLYTTWFATKVTLATPAAKDFDVTSKGQKSDLVKLRSILKASMKDWGKTGDRNVWWGLL
jgi:GLPGLI family protein